MVDRITALLNSFHLHASSAPIEQANLAGLQDPLLGNEELVFSPRSFGIDARERRVLFSLRVDFGIGPSPLLAALPDPVVERVSPQGDLASIVSLLKSEHETGKCGAPVILSRLGDVLVVALLRMQLDRGVATPGLLAGLANPRISKAIVAMHEAPGKSWQNAQLAKTAGLSHTRFKELFSQLVGETPARYLRRWRLVLARTELENGQRVESVAQKYGYRAPDAFSRAFTKEFGVRPTKAAMLNNATSHDSKQGTRNL